jgi:hypothetical protein
MSAQTSLQQQRLQDRLISHQYERSNIGVRRERQLDGFDYFGRTEISTHCVDRNARLGYCGTDHFGVDGENYPVRP